MSSDFVAPDRVLPPFPQGFPGSLALPGVVQPALPLDRVSPLMWRGVVMLSSCIIPKDVPDVSPLDRCICGCRSGACIPQREYQRQRTDPISQHDLPEMILFSVGGKCGYPLGDALVERYTGLDRRDDKMFVDLKSSSIAIRLEVRLLGTASAGSDDGLKPYFQWLPYKAWTRQVGAGSRLYLRKHQSAL